MIDYTIAMQFITWSLVIMMSIGYSVVASCKGYMESDSEEDEQTRMGANIIHNEFQERDFIGRTVYILWLGAKFMAILTDVFKRRDKE